MHPAKTQISLGICPVWSGSSLSTWRSLESLPILIAHSQDWTDWMDAQADLGAQVILLSLSCFSSNDKNFLITTTYSSKGLRLRKSFKFEVDINHATRSSVQSRQFFYLLLGQYNTQWNRLSGYLVIRDTFHQFFMKTYLVGTLKKLKIIPKFSQITHFICSTEYL